MSEQRKLDSRWFEEDRRLPREEQTQAIQDTEKALRSSTLLSRRLSVILEREYEKCNQYEDDFASAGWKKRVLAMNARRKTLREIIGILP